MAIWYFYRLYNGNVCVCANEGVFIGIPSLPSNLTYTYIYIYLLTCLLCLVCQLSSPQKKGYIFHNNNYYRYHHRTTTAKFGSPSFRPGLCFKDFGRDAITQKSTQTVNLGPSLRTHLRERFSWWVSRFFGKLVGDSGEIAPLMLPWLRLSGLNGLAIGELENM